MRWTTTGVAAALAMTMGVAACAPSGHNPGLTGLPPGQTTDAPVTVPADGPAISKVSLGSVAVPQLGSGAGATPVNAALRTIGGRLGSGGRACTVTTTLSDRSVVSFRWLCSDRTVATATFAVGSGKQLALSDVLRGAYLAYMSSTAVSQLTAGGASQALASDAAAPTQAAFSRWDLAADALQVSFPLPSGPVTIDYPAVTLTPFLVPGGPLP